MYFYVFICFIQFPCLMANNIIHMSLITRKPVFRVCNRVRHNPACAAKERGWSDCRCAGWSTPLLFTYGKSWFCLDVTHITCIIASWNRTTLSHCFQHYKDLVESNRLQIWYIILLDNNTNGLYVYICLFSVVLRSPSQVFTGRFSQVMGSLQQRLFYSSLVSEKYFFKWY